MKLGLMNALEIVGDSQRDEKHRDVEVQHGPDGEHDEPDAALQAVPSLAEGPSLDDGRDAAKNQDAGPPVTGCEQDTEPDQPDAARDGVGLLWMELHDRTVPFPRSRGNRLLHMSTVVPPRPSVCVLYATIRRLVENLSG